MWQCEAALIRVITPTLFFALKGDRGQRGAPGPPGDKGFGFPGPKVEFHVVCVLSRGGLISVSLTFRVKGESKDEWVLQDQGVRENLGHQ